MSNVVHALEFVQSVELPDPAIFENAGEGPIDIVPPGFSEDVNQTVTIGSQLAGFASNLAPELRPHISNSFLLAQLAANRHLKDHGGNSRDWYQQYIHVLSNIGWVIEGDASTAREVTGTTLQVHKEIIPILTAALGPGAAAATTVISVLKGLAEMDSDQPWITLFQRESQRASSNQFQISFATQEGGTPRMTLACFELDASKAITQVLFFKFSESNAKLRHFEVKLSVNEPVFKQVKDRIADRVGSYLVDFVSEVKI